MRQFLTLFYKRPRQQEPYHTQIYDCISSHGLALQNTLLKLIHNSSKSANRGKNITWHMTLINVQSFEIYTIQIKKYHIKSYTFNFSRQQPDWVDFINNIVVHTMFVQQIISVQWYNKIEIHRRDITSLASVLQAV